MIFTQLMSVGTVPHEWMDESHNCACLALPCLEVVRRVQRGRCAVTCDDGDDFGDQSQKHTLYCRCDSMDHLRTL